jgi:putative oxidoreductase
MFAKLYSFLIVTGNFFQPFLLLAIRLFWGWQFFKTGLGKLGNIGEIGSFFGTLNIPFPQFSAYLAATTEMVGGLLLLLGFFSRLVALPLIITMIVALLTAHYDVTSMIFEDPVAVTNLSAFTFLMASLIVFIFGPGLFSLDRILRNER